MAEKDSGEGRSGRWRRREARRDSKRSRIEKHGATLRRVYLDAVLRRAARLNKS